MEQESPAPLSRAAHIARQDAVLAVGRRTETGQIIQMKIDVIGNHQIHETIAIVVAKSSASGPPAVATPALA